MIFILVWKGEIIRFHTFSKGRGDSEIGVEMWWNVLNIVIPANLKSKQAEIYQLIRDALSECGRYFDGASVKATHIFYYGA
jgi:hypothetical protein